MLVKFHSLRIEWRAMGDITMREKQRAKVFDKPGILRCMGMRDGMGNFLVRKKSNLREL